jgi:putative membrane protein
MGSLVWLLQWPIRAVILLLVSMLPLGVEVENLWVALVTAVVIGLLGTLLVAPLKFLLGPIWAVTSLGGLIGPISWLYEWLIGIIIFSLAAWLIRGFRLTNGLTSAILGALIYSVLSKLVLGRLGLEVPLTRAARAAVHMIGGGFGVS